MSMEVVMKGFAAAVFGLFLAWNVFSRYDKEIGSESDPESRQRYLPLVFGGLLPFFLGGIFIVGSLIEGPEATLRNLLSMCFRIFLHLSIYYVILSPLLPVLRRYISARACAMLWLIPNYLYLTEMSYMEIPKPALVIHASSGTVRVLFAVWIAGFVLVLIWKILQHFAYRRSLLRDAQPVTDSAVLAVFGAEIEKAGIAKPKFRLLTSAHTATPITIGLFRGSTRVVLPEKPYTEADLKLIFRHELIHIGREDSWSKFFMIFCTAMCWFNPLMWMAMKKSAEDMELSCDETVLLDADDPTRKQYANLILNAAGDDRGFTTCLSSAASTVRYRLRSIVSPGKKASGALVVGLTFFLLCITSGYVALAYGEETGADTVFRGYDLADFSAVYVDVPGGRYDCKYDDLDIPALTAYLAGSHTQEITGNYSFSHDDQEITIRYHTPHGPVLLYLYSDYVRVYYLSDKEIRPQVYHLPEGTDWDYVNRLVPPLPSVTVILDLNAASLNTTITRLSITDPEGTRVLMDRVLDPQEANGIFGSRIYERAAFLFSMPLNAPATLLVQSWDQETSYTISQSDLHSDFTFQMPPFPAHFTLTASFRGPDGIYDATFRFDVGDLDSN